MSYVLLSLRTVRRCHLAMTASMPLSANSGCSFFLTRRKGSANFGVSFVPAGGRPYASSPRRTGRRCGVCWPMS